MTILLLNDTCETDGGSARIALEDAYAMAQRGHRVIFFSACGVIPEQAGGIEWISLRQDSILDERRRWLAATRGIWNFEAAAELRKVLAVLAPSTTVIHLHSWSKALSGSVVAEARRARFKMVSTLHDYFVLCPNGGLYDYPKRSVCHLRPMSLSCVARNCDSRRYLHKLWRVVRQTTWRYLAGIPDSFTTMIAVSTFEAQKLKAYGLHGDVKVIDNLPHIEALSRDSHDNQRNGILFAGRVSAEKGVEVYLRASAKAGMKATVLGDGPLAPKLSREWPAAHFSGWLRRSNLLERLQQSLAVVVPTLCFETYGLIVAEAAAMGAASIVSDHGASAALVEEGVTGLHFKAGDADDLARKMTYVRDHADLVVAMGLEARRRFWTDYAERQEIRLRKIEMVYREHLDSK